MLRIERISRETHPEKFKELDKMDECRRRGHGKLITHPDGFIECFDCGELLGRLALDELEYVDGEDPEPKVQ